MPKSTQKFESAYVPLSALLYLACLAFPAYYIGENFEPQPAFSAFLIGWLGLIDSHFSWYANPLFLLALLLRNRPGPSSVLGFGAVVLAVSFLFHDQIIASEAPTFKPIKAYGLGYGLWLTSLVVLFVGQARRALELSGPLISIASYVVSALVPVFYAKYYFTNPDSPLAVTNERTRAWEASCASAGQKILKRTDDVRGIFFDPDWESSGGGGGVLGLGQVNSGHILFYETKDKKNPGSYLKHALKDFRGVPVGKLESEYAVLTTFHDIPPRLNIFGATVTIKDLRDNSVLATSTYFVDRETWKFCGATRDRSATSALMHDVLGLTHKYPSVYK